MLLALLAGLAHIDARRFVEPVAMLGQYTPGIVPSAVIYLLLGLGLIGHVHFTGMHSLWRVRRVEITGKLGSRWFASAALALTISIVLALVLPARYSAGVPLSLARMVIWIITGLANIMGIFLALPMIIASLFDAELRVQPVPRFNMPSVMMPQRPDSPWWETLRFVLLWAIIAGGVAYSFYRFLRQRRGFLEWLAALPLVRWLAAVLRGLRRSVTGLISGAAGQTSSRAGQRWAKDETAPRSLSLRSLSPVQVVRYFYLSTLRRANRTGHGKLPHQTPYEYETQLREQLPPTENDLHTLTEAFVEGRYGRRAFEAEDVGPIRRSWRRLRRAFRRLRSGRLP